VAEDGLVCMGKYEENAKEGRLYCLILMDLFMPRMSGFEATQKIRELEDTKGYTRTKIIGCTSQNDEKTIERCYGLGMDQMICKPVQF